MNTQWSSPNSVWVISTDNELQKHLKRVVWWSLIIFYAVLEKKDMIGLLHDKGMGVFKWAENVDHMAVKSG